MPPSEAKNRSRRKGFFLLKPIQLRVVHRDDLRRNG
jgi:hypothetical protein